MLDQITPEQWISFFGLLAAAGFIIRYLVREKESLIGAIREEKTYSRGLNDLHHENHVKTIETLNGVVTTVDKVTSAVERNTHAIGEMKDTVNKCEGQ